MIHLPKENKVSEDFDRTKFRDTDDYPDNLLLALGILPSGDKQEHKQQMEGLEIAFTSLSDIEREIIVARFRDEKTLQECSEGKDVTRQYIQNLEQKALMKLRHPTRKALITYGPDTVGYYNQLKVKIELLEKHIEVLKDEIDRSESALGRYKNWSKDGFLKKKEEFAAISIEMLNLSSRARYGLNREKVFNLYDLSRYSHQDLLRIRRLGEMTVKEIEQKAAEFGLYIQDCEPVK